MAYKCCAVHCRFNYSGKEVAAIISFPMGVYISKFLSITRLKIEKKIFSLQDTHLNSLMNMLYSTNSLITECSA